MAEQEEGEKEHEPSQKKLDDARRKGEIARSADLTTSFSYLGLLAGTFVLGPAAILQVGSTLTGLLDHSNEASIEAFSGGGTALNGGMLVDVGLGLAPWLIVPGLFAIAAILGQRGFVFAPEKLQPKLSRISPISNAKNKFGRSGLFEFAKSATKLSIYGFVLFTLLWMERDHILGLVHADPAVIMGQLSLLLIKFLTIVFIISVSIGGLDFTFQFQEHKRKNMMTRQEVKDETKDSEGDAGMKHQRRQRGYDIAMNQMMQDVPDADVIVVNPTHYAVALKWSRQPGEAPICVAKGVDEIAAKIREIANENAVPIHRDPPTARAIYATIEIGQQILPDHFKPVAAAIRFAERIRAKATAQR